ncbi:hypothetical protein ZIOFF_068330 [Zingiber officinale]|uniref:Deoxyuridine 5'-triphosphate nucleotidohydrolase n=1 Tax=Zingiber officinale TaxID=94328 RepID=A0A8J5ET92_ZINOF|nr:hypothetical protein ZIOFF_068330 [Zingiber officinale]
MIGRLSNTPNVPFAYKVSGMVDYLTSHGVNALPGRRYSTSQLQGMNWIIRLTQINFPMQPAEVSRQNLFDGRISISFQNYVTTPSANQDEVISSDEEEIRNHILAVLIKQVIQIQVKKLTPIAIIPRRYSDEAVCYDLSSDETVTIEPRGQSLISTRVAIMIPKGLYGQIATRFSIACRLGVHVGARVIDNDYEDYIRDYCTVEDDGDWDDEFFIAITDATFKEEEEPWDMEYPLLARLAEHWTLMDVSSRLNPFYSNSVL